MRVVAINQGTTGSKIKKTRQDRIYNPSAIAAGTRERFAGALRRCRNWRL